MSGVTEELLGNQLSVELLTTPSAPDWQPRDGEYHGGPYRLQVEPIARDRDMALLRIKISREDGRPFVLHNLRVSFELSGVDVHGSWDAQADPVDVQRLRMMPFGRGRMFGDGTVAANRGVPLKMLLHRSGQSRWLVGTVDQDDETRIDVRPDIRSGMYHIEVHKLPLERPPRGFGPPPKGLMPPKPHYALHTDCYQEYIYVSRAQKDWYEAVQDYVAICDEISGFRQEPIPDAAYEPVFCTWYAVFKDVTAAWTEQAARTAANLGFGTLIVDDGWFTANGQERGYFHAGDWQPLPARFPDMAAHVRRVQDMGLSYVLWVAPFMVGSESRASEELAEYLLPIPHDMLAPLGFRSLCPRNPEVREHIRGTLLRLMNDYHLDGFKLDFVDAVDLNPCLLEHEHDVETTGRGVHQTLRDAYQALRRQNPDVLIEFRQTYANLAMRDCATMFRGFDVPFDFDANRWNITMTRAVAGRVPAHLDPAYWLPDELNENVARQMINAIFAVPTVSVDWELLPQEHLQIVKAWLRFYHDHLDVLAHGHFRPFMASGSLPALLLHREGQAVLGVFNEAVPPICLPPDTEELYVLNGANEEQVRLWLDGVEGEYAGEVYGLFHDRLGQVAAGPLGTLQMRVPVGGYALLRRAS